MAEVLIRHPEGFPLGFTSITRMDESTHNVGIHFAILKLKSGDELKINSLFESIYLLLQGMATFIYGDDVVKTVRRNSLFDEHPAAIHFSEKTFVNIKAITDCEFAVIEIENHKQFPTLIVDETNLQKLSHSGVNTRNIINKTNSPLARLNVGEVVARAGTYSQKLILEHLPKIHHYRFSEVQGFAFADNGEEILKINQFDTHKMLNHRKNTQISAAGYNMFYLWVTSVY